MDFGSSGSGGGLDLGGAAGALSQDKELQHFLQVEQQKMALQEQINKMTLTCWDLCAPDRLGSKMDSKTETCLTNCVDRFIDTSVFITQRFSNMLSKRISQMDD